jgi:hypothetical protein
MLRTWSFPTQSSALKTISPSQPEESSDSRLRAFDRETEAKFRQIRKQNLDELSFFDRQWILNHEPQIARGKHYLNVRDLDARESVLSETQRLEQKRKAQRTALLRKQQRTLDQFYEIRRKERSLFRCDSSATTMSLPTPPIEDVNTARPIRITKKVRRANAFLPGRTKFLGSKDVKIGKFRVSEVEKEGDRYGDLLDSENLKKVLAGTERSWCRHRRETGFVGLESVDVCEENEE